MEPLASRLKDERTKRKLTQQQIADILGINRVTYQGYESGKHEPDLSILIKLSDTFDRSTDYLLGKYNQA